MSLRKIAANYIFVPGYPLVKNGYVVLETVGLPMSWIPAE